jgi:hypothetical protein
MDEYQLMRAGQLHQGWEALRLGRLLFLLESVANNPELSWPAEMIKHGAQVLSRENLPAVVENISQFTSGVELALWPFLCGLCNILYWMAQSGKCCPGIQARVINPF